MSGNDRRRQKKLEKKNARRKEKKKAVAREESGGLPAQFAIAAKQPILHCWMEDILDRTGKGAIAISRKLPNGKVAVAELIVDRLCLGAKTVWVAIDSQSEYEEFIVDGLIKKYPGKHVPPEDAYKLILGAVDYARYLGFEPHENYERGMILFEGVDPAKSTRTWEFGKNGKPFYFAGEYDNQTYRDSVIAILTKSCGEGGFHYAVPDASGEMITEFGDFDMGRRGWKQ